MFFSKTKNKLNINPLQAEKFKRLKIDNMKNLEKVTNVLFSNRRKMINKNIKKLLNDKKIDKLKDLNLTSRPSEIKPEIFYKITEMYEDL